MKLALLSPSLALGGVERHLMDLIGNLSATIETIVVVIDNPGWIHPKGISAMEQYAPVYIRPIDQIDAFLIHEKIDVVIAWGITQLSEMLQEFPGKVVVCCHGSDVEWTGYYIQKCMPVADLFVGVSKAVLRPLALVEPQRVRIIPNGINREHSTPTISKAKAREQFGIPADTFVVGYVGRFSEEKRIDIMIQAVRQIDGCMIVMAGAGQQEPYLRELAAPLGNRALFIEHSYQINNLNAAIDCFCGLAKEEGFWFGGTEAAAAGVPLVCTTVGVLEEIKEEHGLLWEEISKEATVTELIEAIQRLKNDTTIPFKVARLKNVLEQFTVEKNAREWEKLLTELTHENIEYQQRPTVNFLEVPNVVGIFALTYPTLLYYKYAGTSELRLDIESSADKFATHWEYQSAHYITLSGAAPFRFRRAARTLEIPVPPPTYKYEVAQYEPFTIGPMFIVDKAGVPIDLRDKTLTFTASIAPVTVVFELTGSAIAISGAFYNTVYVTSTSENTQIDQTYTWVLRDELDNTLSQGLLAVTSPIIGFHCCNPDCETIPMLLVSPVVGRMYSDLPAYEAGVTQCQISNQNTR